MLTRAVAVLIAASALTAATGVAAGAATAGAAEAPPAGCGPAGYPGAYGIWCPGRIHLVVRGDSLWNLAQASLGNGRLWPEIYILGRGRPRPCTRTVIFSGQILLIPPAGAQPDWGQAAQPGSCPPAQPQGVPSRPAAQPAPAVSPSPAPAVTTTRPPAPAPMATTPSARRHVPAAPVRLPPGDLAGLGAAAAISAAAVLARRRWRHRRRAGILPAAEHGSGGPAPEPALPVSVEVGQVPGRPRWEDSGAEPDDPYGPEVPWETGPGIVAPAGSRVASWPHAAPASPGWLTANPPSAARAPERPAGAILFGVRDGQEVTADIAAMGGLGLTGPGAPAAARAILAALLSQTRTGPEDPAALAIVPADDAVLLPPAFPPLGSGVPGLSRPPSLTAALDELEAVILRRARLAQPCDDEEPVPHAAPASRPVVALITASAHADTPRLRGITASGQDLGITAVLLGTWPRGVTCHIGADGMVTATSPADAGLDGIRLRCLEPGDLAALAGAVSTPPGTGTSAPAAPQAAHGRPSRPVPAAAPASGAGTGAGSRPVRISVLGPLRITAADGEIGIGLRKARELLAFLAVHGPDGATGDAISEALWPGAPPGQGKHQRNLAVRKARELLRSSAGRSAPMWIILAAERYRLDPALIEADLWQFQAALETARAASTDEERLAACQQAAGCYRGPLCDGAGYDWAEPHAENARLRALDAWTRIAGILQDTDPEQALAALETALTHDPCNEYLYQQMMRLQAAAGRADAVRRTFELLQARLAGLGAAPRLSTRQTVADLLGDSGPRPRQQPSGGQHEQRTG